MSKLRTLSEPQYDQLFGPKGADETIQGIDYALRRFKELGVPVPVGSRLRRARDIIESSATKLGALRRSTKTRRVLTEAHRTAIEFYAIARSLNPKVLPVPKAVRRKLVLAYGGADDPAQDSDHTIVARNTQFELWVAAWLTAGRKPVRVAEPDLQFAFRFQWCGLAAKRVRAPGQIMKRVRQASDQVERNSGTGFISLALDNYSLARKIRSRTELAAGSRFLASYREIEDAADWLMSKAPHIRALLCFGHYARWLPGEEPPSLQMSNLTRIYMLPWDATDAEYMDAYFDEHRVAFREAWRKM